MKYTGIVRKMEVINSDIVEYYFRSDNNKIYLNDKLGKKITIRFDDEIKCLSCGRKTKKSFAQGYCYPCFIKVPETAPCILRPELCEAHLGKARDIAWSEKNCLQEHIVYLAVSSGLKVGVTRASQVPTRWIDQGAARAVKLASTPNRHTAGVIEVELKKYFSDKTSWQKMLKNDINEEIDLIHEKERAAFYLKNNELKQYITDDNKITEIKYPVIKYPTKVKSINLDKEKEYTGILNGIKGQYLIFDNEKVINIRKYGGYVLEIDL